jgi:hypothetical protein
MYFPVNRLPKIQVSDSSSRQAIPTVELAFEGRFNVSFNLREGAEPDKIATDLINNLQGEDYLIYVRSGDITDIS